MRIWRDFNRTFDLFTRHTKDEGKEESKHTIGDANKETFKTVFFFQSKHKTKRETCNKEDKGTFGLIFLICHYGHDGLLLLMGQFLQSVAQCRKEDFTRSHSPFANVLICCAHKHTQTHKEYVWLWKRVIEKKCVREERREREIEKERKKERERER